MALGLAACPPYEFGTNYVVRAYAGEGRAASSVATLITTQFYIISIDGRRPPVRYLERNQPGFGFPVPIGLEVEPGKHRLVLQPFVAGAMPSGAGGATVTTLDPDGPRTLVIDVEVAAGRIYDLEVRQTSVKHASGPGEWSVATVAAKVTDITGSKSDPTRKRPFTRLE